MRRKSPDRISYVASKLGNLWQTVALLSGMGLLMALVGYFLAGALGALWVVSFGITLILLTPGIDPHMVLRLYRARVMGYSHAPRIHDLLAILCRRAGLERPPQLYFLPSYTITAFTVGSRKNPAIALSHGLLHVMGMRELGAILAHEIAHITSGDLRLMSMADIASRLTATLSFAGQILLIINLPLIAAGKATVSWLLIITLIAAPTVSALLQLALSRTREYDADLESLRISGDPEALAVALEKIERYQHSWLERALMPGTKTPYPSLLRTHPPTAERIERILTMAPPDHISPAVLETERAPFESPFDTIRRPRRNIWGLWY
ncbi:zinc metalloprotease HtpX [Desulfurispirillum indicum]|uniref:zinc metalloprotease HtpX n=1 Tax=Desulfurispirillum indicum TaxID=936456 RepID=UPI001CF9FE96|nr:zinc metalloprotease HtpX [Desulfurispirillum indicum]UCZ57155.1 zinc metalloprotease HtpX [Desulfurispirillum indicum]